MRRRYGFSRGTTLINTLPCLAKPGKITPALAGGARVVVARPSRTLDGVLPLIAAVAPNIISFNPEAGTLTLRRQPGFITLYSEQVMMSQVQDPEEGQELLAALRDLVNQRWEQRDRIQPVTAARRTPRPLDVWALLPQSNCKQCGEPACMAFAFGLLQHKRALEECPVIASNAAFTERRAQLAALV